MTNSCCAGCYYYGMCCGQSKCEYYDPVDDSNIDDDLKTYVERDKERYIKDWLIYVNEYSDEQYPADSIYILHGME